ncbi:N-acetyl sugar amidotransferase [Dyadobacter alkalitolerans]|uniref:N-acetyl sugar amidotransferase n=1 Tax=Dyadobacter alkalitolerans TaxID=492736 RepID=UPI0006888467|nr:N-acetyl sugar amidotransferase [Dyadobacter alkalitolerans]
MRVCSEGVWDETVPGITFDKDGVSNFCRLQQQMMADYPQGEKGQTDWEKHVAEIKKAGENKRYDCVIGVSGGVDSSYLLHIAKEYGLRPLALNLDNGFNSEIAVQNIRKITSRLNIDLETYVIDYEEVKDLIKAYMRASVPWIDAPTDLAIKAVMYKVADAEGIKFILRGNDFRSEGKQPKEWTYSDARQLKYLHQKFGSGVKLRTYPMLTLSRMLYCGLVRQIKDIRPYYYLNYSKQTAKALLMEEYDWKDYGGHHHENLFTKFAMAFWLPAKFGIDKRKISLSAQVLNTVMTRAEALQLLNQPYSSEKELLELKDYILKKLEMSVLEYDEVWERAIKDPFDYPSNYKLIMGLATRFKPVLKKLYAFKPMSVSANEVIAENEKGVNS